MNDGTKRVTWLSVALLGLCSVAVLQAGGPHTPALSQAGGDSAADKEPALTAEDKNYLDGLMRDFLFDPKGAVRVTVPTVVRTVWAEAGEAAADGWLVPGKDGKPGRVYFTDGASMPAPPDQKIKKVDFVAACRTRYTPPAKKAGEKKDDLDHDEVFRKMGRTAVGALNDDDLAMAAWLYRLGHEDLAARALAAARNSEGDPRQRLRNELAWSAFAGMVHAYMVRADAEALTHGERLLRLYAAEAAGKDYRQAQQVLAELKRRQQKGTFGQAPPEKWPEGFDRWDLKKKLAYLIDALEEVDARQWGQPGGVDFASDRRVVELIRLGDPAVPALIDALEKDERLTRSVHFWRDFAPSRTVLGVREAVLTALMSILRVRVFEPVSTGDNFTARGEGAAKGMAKRLWAYWNEYGHLPFDERMMKILTDPQTNFEAKREAAENLATLTEDRRLRTTIYPTVIGADAPRKPNPVVAKFSKPTVADAILAAMDADLKAHDAKPIDELHDYHRRHLEDDYLGPLVELGDKRVAAELARRSQGAATSRMRRKWAYAAYWLGDPQPLQRFADDFRLGNIRLPANDRPKTNDSDQPGNVELLGIIRALASAATPEADRALDALADGQHPYHRMAAERILKGGIDGSDRTGWFVHPYCLRILRACLEDRSLTGATYVIEEGNLRLKEKDGWSGTTVPEFLADPAIRRNQAPERACDAAAEKLGALVVGLPRYHPLFKDADKRLTAFKTAFDRFAGHYRRATWRERESLGLSSWTPAYLPDIRPLDRAATPADVKAGKALFQLDGKGKPANLKLPAVAVLKRDEKQEAPPRVLIVQAEIGPDGTVTYGIITRRDVRAVPERELTGIKTFAQLDQEDAAAREKDKKE